MLKLVFAVCPSVTAPDKLISPPGLGGILSVTTKSNVIGSTAFKPEGSSTSTKTEALPPEF